MPSVTVLQPAKKIPPNVVEQIYSVLGIDFLVAGGSSLYFEPTQKFGYLGKQACRGEGLRAS